MNIDKAIHEVNDYLHGREIRWHDFNSVGVIEDYYDYYYAEDRLYIIRDRIRSTYWFCHASSPAHALETMRDEMRSIFDREEDE